jgi:hypothetical protein
LWLTHRDCRILIVRAWCSECVHTHTGPRFIVSSEGRESHQPQVIRASHTSSKILVPDGPRTPNLSHWSRMRYHCATGSLPPLTHICLHSRDERSVSRACHWVLSPLYILYRVTVISIAVTLDHHIQLSTCGLWPLLRACRWGMKDGGVGERVCFMSTTPHGGQNG